MYRISNDSFVQFQHLGRRESIRTLGDYSKPSHEGSQLPLEILARDNDGSLPSDTVKNPKLSTSLVLSARSYPTEDPQCSTHIHVSINAITIHPKQQNDSRDSMAEEEKKEREGDPKDTNTIAYIEERRETPLLDQKDITVVSNSGSNKDDEGIAWLAVEEPLDLVDTSEESAYESLIKEMPKCSLNYDFGIIKQGVDSQETLKILCILVFKFND
ncbi:hypothetical protein Tco_0355647 [Tanacetum coccineum]